MAASLARRGGESGLGPRLAEGGPLAIAMGKRVFVAAEGVEIEPRSMRPIGSWLHHPLVTLDTAPGDLPRSLRAAAHCTPS